MSNFTNKVLSALLTIEQEIKHHGAVMTVEKSENGLISISLNMQGGNVTAYSQFLRDALITMAECLEVQE